MARNFMTFPPVILNYSKKKSSTFITTSPSLLFIVTNEKQFLSQRILLQKNVQQLI